MRNFILVTLSTLFLFSACNHDEFGNKVILTSIQGKAQKGPFINGSNVVVYELDKNLKPTGRSFNSRIKNNQGLYSIDSVSLSSSYVQVEVQGLYYSELDGNVSFREITINSLVKLSEGKTSNVNLITQIENTRVKNLIRSGLSFEDAKRQSLEELIQVFSYPYEVNGTSESFDLFGGNQDGIFLFCLSSVLLATNDDYDATKHASWLNFLLELEDDFGDNGKIDSSDLMNRLKLGAFYTLQNANSIREGFKRTIEITKATIEVPYFEPIIELLFKENNNSQSNDFNDVMDFFPFPSKTNIARLLDGTLITDQDLVLALEAPDNVQNYNFSLELNSGSENKQGQFSLESPAWSNYTVNENVSYWSVNASINLPSNSLIGKIEIPFSYTGMGWVNLSANFFQNGGAAEDLSKMFFWNTNSALPAEIDTVIISDAIDSYINYGVNGFDKPTYLIFENVETLQTLRFKYVLNLIGLEFPKLKQVSNEFTIDFNPVLRVFKAPQLETVNGYFIFTNNPLIQNFNVSSLATIDDYVVIQRNNKLETFNLGGKSFGADFSDIMKGQYSIRWKFNDQILKDSNY
jgi:hypothetical protein